MQLVRLILASASPRRAELLASAGFAFDVIPAEVPETPAPGESAADYTLRVAREKARAVAATLDGQDAVILAADTEVVADRRILGKPANASEAAEMLRLLSGSDHDVLTAVVIRAGERELADVVWTRVRFTLLSKQDIAWYVASGEPMGKAGAYGIQGLGARFIDRIEGSWSNVVGLPIHRVAELLKSLAVR
ncbi:MAG: Maf family protein [Vicinamibacterales bacterium]